MIKMYADGAYSSSRNQGGWAFVVLRDDVKIHSGFFPEMDTTNNRMEIMAVLEGCKWLKKNKIDTVTIVTDSMYVIGTMRDGWKRNVNLDLWLKMDEELNELNITWQHVKGHTGDKYNELCDALAVEASHFKEI